MKIIKTAVVTTALSATSAFAVEIDRSRQPVGILFEDGNRIEFSFSRTNPSITGSDILAVPGAPTGNIAENFSTLGAGLKIQLNDRWSFAFIADEPYGADVFYGTSPATSVLGGTGATAESYGLTALARYKFNENWGVHGGLKYQSISANVSLGGIRFGGLSGYNSTFGSDGDVGFVVGGTYEIPDIALRIAVTYNSATNHDLPTTETLGGAPLGSSTTPVKAPESVNFDFQTGIAANTLLLGNIRWANYDQTSVSPVAFAGLTPPGASDSLTALETGYDINLGVARRFNDKWSGSIILGYGSTKRTNLVSPLAPVDGETSLSLGVRYDVNERFEISGGVRYTKLGDALAAPSGVLPGASFTNNDAISAGLRLVAKF